MLTNGSPHSLAKASLCFLVLWALCLSLTGCTALEGQMADNTNRCKIIDDTTLKVSGPTNSEMKACLSDNINEKTEFLIITSGGGNALKAMDIGDLIAPHQLKLIISERCSSSCANYLLPIAKEIYVEANSLIMLHGSVDEGFVEDARKLQSDTLIRQFEDLRARQNDYALRYNIPSAWLLERKNYSSHGSTVVGLIGQFSDFHPATPERSKLLPGPAFMRSCFPQIKITFSDAALPIKAVHDVKVARTLAGQGYFSSGTARCAA